MSRSFAHLIVATAVTCLLVLACFEVPGDWNWSGVWEYRQKFISGWLVTLGLSLAALVLSVAIGLVVALFLALIGMWTKKSLPMSMAASVVPASTRADPVSPLC